MIIYNQKSLLRLKKYWKGMILALACAGILLGLLTATFAESSNDKVYHITINYDPLKISTNQDGFTELQMKRSNARDFLTQSTALTGAPKLPVDSLIIYLKEGETLKDVKVTNQRFDTIQLKTDVQYIIPPQKSGENNQSRGQKNNAIYQSTSLYPGVTLEQNIIQYYHGYKLALIPVHPIQYNPAAKLVQAATKLSFQIETNIQAGPVPGTNPKPKANHQQEIRDMIDNKDALDSTLPEQITKFFNSSQGVVYADDPSYEYIMVGPKAFQNACQGLLNLRISQGFTGTYLAVEDILTSYSGVDLAEKIRNCLNHYCYNHNTDYVLLVGDTNLVPSRCIMVDTVPDFKKSGKEVYETAPSDVYYACVDGSYNSNNNDNWGELNDGDGGGAVDKMPDLAIGRIPAGSIRELNYHIYKIMQYELRPQSTKVLLIQSKMWDTENVFDHLDGAFQVLTPKGYTARVLNNEDPSKKYDQNDVVNEMNTNNYDLVLNNQHSNPWGIAELGWANLTGYDPTNNPQVTNTNPFFFYTGGCSPNRFKVYDSISEYMTAKSPYGAYAFVGHTSSGWTDPSMEYLKSMLTNAIKATVSSARREKCLGQLLNKHKLDLVSKSPGDFNDYTVTRQLFYNVNIMGDPLSPLIKTGFTDLPTNSNILPNIQESTNIKISKPDEENVLAQGKSLTIETNNIDSAVTITSVKFYYQELKGSAGYQYLGEDTTSPFTYTWGTPVSGEYLLKVEGYNGTTKVGEDTRFIRVAQEIKPAITDIHFPVQNADYRVGQPIFVCAKATDSDGWIEEIDFDFNYNDGSTTPIHEDWQREQVPPFNAYITAKQPKGSSTHTVTVTAKALDNHMFVSNTSSSISFSFNVVEYNPPTISITKPTASQKLNINEKAEISLQVDDPKNWKDEDGGIGNVNVKVKRLLDGNVQDLGTKRDLGKSATPSFDFTPTVASDYTITATVSDYDGITKETSITVKVINPNAPLSFENPSKPWSPVSTNVTLGTDTTLKTEGDSSMVLKGTHYMEFQSAVFSSAEIDYYSNEMSLDVYVPSPLTDSYIGFVQLYFTAPGAYRNHEWIAQCDMKDFTPGQWNTATFTLPSWVVDILKGNSNGLVLGMTLNTNQTGYFRIDNLRFTGSLVIK